MLGRLRTARRVLEEATVRRHHPAPATGRDELVTRLRSALLGESVPDERTALLVSVLVDVHWKLFVPRKAVREAFRRGAEIRDGIGKQELAIVSAARVALSNSDGYSSSL